MRRWLVPAITAALLITLGGSVAAQFGGRYRSAPVDAPIDKAPPYDGRFVFARLKYTTGPGGYYYGGLPAWAHGYIPIREGSRAESSMVKILNAVTNMNPHVDGTRVVDVSDPELFQYPVTYVTEAGFMEMNDKDI